jgi:uncharacterized protein YgbK (DUF1537 family)
VVSFSVRDWLVAADDRTGAFEVAALFAELVGPVVVTVGSALTGSGVVDLGSRGMAASDAARVAASVDASPSAWVAHKIDSTLRGNWATELRARQRATGRRVDARRPEMRRTCIGGVVFVDGAPIGSVLDCLGEADLLADAGNLRAWLDGNGIFALCDVPDSGAMHAAAGILVGHDVLLAGPAGPLGAAFAIDRGARSKNDNVRIADPVLVVRGSDNPVAREQVRRLQTVRPDVAVLATTAAEGDLNPAAVVALAARAWVKIEHDQTRTIVIIGGETAAALLGDSPRVITGFAAVGMPCVQGDGGSLIVTKAGGFGGPDALVELLRGENC